MPALSFMAQSDPLLRSFVPQLFKFLLLFLFWQSIELFEFSLHTLTLFNAMVELTLDLGNPLAFDFFVKDQAALFTDLSEPIFSLFWVQPLQLFLFGSYQLLLRRHVQFGKLFLNAF